ncbi:MAG: LTA synthase family protein [Prevotella sp.]|nr:LTA synthase family protein [Prevotella sp.]
MVVILLESCGAVFTELGGRTDIMPNLNSLSKEGVFFTCCYANSWRTDRGTLCTLSGYPSFPASSVMKMPEKSRTMPSIAKTLQAEGYSTTYLYGGDINFTNMKGYLIGTGWQRLISMDDYSSEERKTAQWGVRDDITFGTLTSLIETADKSKPFLIGYSTLSSHEPWDVPLQKLDNKIENAFCYLDQCIGDFISKLKASEAWDNTLVILLPDHSISHKGMDNTNPLKNQIPMLWLGGVVKEPRRIETICNQTDLAATLLGQMHLPHDDFQFSRDVLSKTYRKPFAVHNYNNAQLMIDSTGYILYDFDASMFIVEKSNESERMERLNKAILQVTATDLKQR